MTRKSFCPYCRKEAAKENNPSWPFCSQRCKMIDLGKWAKEEYRVPGEPLQNADLEKKDDDDDFLM